MKKKNKDKKLSIRITHSLDRELETTARKLNIKKSDLIRGMLSDSGQNTHLLKIKNEHAVAIIHTIWNMVEHEYGNDSYIHELLEELEEIYE